MQNPFPRIVTDPAILAGKPHVKGTRLSVEFILELLASGGNHADILKTYPALKVDDVEQALRYAANVLKHDVVVNTRVAG